MLRPWWFKNIYLFDLKIPTAITDFTGSASETGISNRTYFDCTVIAYHSDYAMSSQEHGVVCQGSECELPVSRQFNHTATWPKRLSPYTPILPYFKHSMEYHIPHFHSKIRRKYPTPKQKLSGTSTYKHSNIELFY